MLKIIKEAVQLGLHFLIYPRKSVDLLLQHPRRNQLSWAFLLISDGLWMILTLYVNVFLKQSSRGREMILGVSLGPDIIVSLLTIPIAATAIFCASFLFSKVSRLFKANGDYKITFLVLAITLNAGSAFFDLPYEFAVGVLTGAPWEIMESFPKFFYCGCFIMFYPILWTFIITILALSHLYKLPVLKTIVTFLISVLPMFALLMFFVA